MKRLFLFCTFFSFFTVFCAFISQKSFAAPPVATQSAFVATISGSDTAPADGITIASMTATLKDHTGLILAGDIVTLSAPSDPTFSFSPSSIALNSQGIATFSATSTQVGTDPITVTDLTQSTSLVALGNIIFTAVVTSTPTPTSGPTPTFTPTPTGTGFICTGNTDNPPDAPNLYEITATQSAATLYIVQPQKPFTSFMVGYGLTQSADTFLVAYQQSTSSGAITYTVNSLNQNHRYYFHVRAVNQCAPGPWSRTLSAYIGDPNSESGGSGLNPGSHALLITSIVGGAAVIIGMALIILF